MYECSERERGTGIARWLATIPLGRFPTSAVTPECGRSLIRRLNSPGKWRAKVMTNVGGHGTT